MAARAHRHRRHRRWRPILGARARFYVVTLLTIVTVAYVVVPLTVDLGDSMNAYAPKYYDPKDFTRGDYLADQARHGLLPASMNVWLSGLSLDRVVGIGLVCVVIIAWLTILPDTSRSGRRTL